MPVTGVSVRIPAVLGVECLSAGRGFGVQLMARPWLELAVASVSGPSGSAVGGGVLLALGIVGYAIPTRR